MTAALKGGEWSTAQPGQTLSPGKTRYPFYRRLGRPQGRFGRAENLVSTGIRTRTVQPAVSRYTDWATRPTIKKEHQWNYPRQAMHVERSIKAHSCKSCCNGKAISTAYSECVIVALGIENARRMRHIFICGLPTSTPFFHIISYMARFSGGKKVIENKMCILIFAPTSVRNISHSKKNWETYDKKCTQVFM